MVTDDVMARLMAVEALPRGERLARYIDPSGSAKPYIDALWERLFDGSRTLNALDNLFALDDVVPPRCVSLREHANRWRAYAAPLRRCREDRRRVWKQYSRLRSRTNNRYSAIAMLANSLDEE